MKICTSRLFEAEAGHRAKSFHRLSSPAIQVTLPVRNSQEIPNNLLDVVRVWNGENECAGRPQNPMNFFDSKEWIRDVFEHLDAKSEIEGRFGKRNSVRDVTNEDPGSLELRCDFYTLISNALRKELS